jgi:hypothetical protein
MLLPLIVKTPFATKRKMKINVVQQLVFAVLCNVQNPWFTSKMPANSSVKIEIAAIQASIAAAPTVPAA